MDISDKSEFFTPPMFLHQIDTDRDGISGSRGPEAGTAEEVERDARNTELVYDGVLQCYGRTWRLVITGDIADYVKDTHLQVPTVAGAYTLPLFSST